MSLRKKSIKKYFKNIAKTDVVTNKNLLSLIKPFLTNKGHIDREKTVLETDNEAIIDSLVVG